MITKITCRNSFEVLDFNCNDFGFTFNIGGSYLGIIIRQQWVITILSSSLSGTSSGIPLISIFSRLEYCVVVGEGPVQSSRWNPKNLLPCLLVLTILFLVLYSPKLNFSLQYLDI